MTAPNLTALRDLEKRLCEAGAPDTLKKRPHNYSSPVHFWAKVNKTDSCWLWTGATCVRGYGILTFQGNAWRAHRLSYTLTNCSIPIGMFICHKCDNPLCVRPDHLFAGTQSSNMRDMVAKGRGYHIGYANRTHCKRGHPFNDTNTKFSRDAGYRMCRICIRLKKKEAYYRRKQQAALIAQAEVEK